MENRIIAEFNAEFGSKVENISKSHSLVDKYVSQINAIEEKVRISCAIAFLFILF